MKSAEETDIAIHYFHCDHLGTPLALTNQLGQIDWVGKYDPWGNIEEEFNPQGIEQNIRLPGQYHDRETGLYYNRHRYYDSNVGSYINQDPIGLMGGFNFYLYVENQPIRYLDPKGLCTVKHFIKKADTPKGASSCSYDGKNFAAPPGTNFSDVYKAGNTAAAALEISPVAFAIIANEAIGQCGTYDYQRDVKSETFIAPYTDASNFAVGVYMAGAGLSYEDVEELGKTYAFLKGSTGDMSKKIEYWKAGWNAAHAGGLSCICK
jgi:RHS repeat-associated protein